MYNIFSNCIISCVNHNKTPEPGAYQNCIVSSSDKFKIQQVVPSEGGQRGKDSC